VSSGGRRGKLLAREQAVLVQDFTQAAPLLALLVEGELQLVRGDSRQLQRELAEAGLPGPDGTQGVVVTHSTFRRIETHWEAAMC